MEGRKAIDVAKIFIKENIDGLNNSLNGNMKMNKLLYFSQLISLAMENETLFDDDMYAFEKGVVVESVRKEYKNNYSKLIEECSSFNMELNKKEKNIIEITKDIFGSIDSNELSELTHQHEIWKYYYSKSTTNSNCGCKYNTYESRININDFNDKFRKDLDTIKDVVSSYFQIKEEENDEQFIELNGIKFYYDPNDISLSEEIVLELERFPAIDNAYSLYIDDKQGLVIY